MISRFLVTFLCLLLIPLSVDAKLSKEEKIAASAVFAAAKVKKNKDSNTKNVKPKLATIDVSGVDSELKKNIELHMPVSIPKCNADKGDVKQFFSTVKKHLRKASRALGYYDSEFRSGGKLADGCWKLRLRITPGRVTKVVSQTIKIMGEGRNEPRLQKILKQFPYKIGDNLNHKKYTDFKTNLSETALSLGYFDAEFNKHIIRVNPLIYQASIALILDTGKRYRYGEVTIDQKVLSDKTIQKYLIIKEGNIYKTEDLINQQQILQRSGYYKLIKVNVLHDQAKNYQIPISIYLERNKRNNYKFKLGYGSDTGGRISAEMDRRWTGSKGKKLKAKVQYAENLTGLSLELVSPRKNPEDNNLVYTFDWKKDKNDDVVSRSINVGANYTRKRPNDWIQKASVDLLLDTTKNAGEESNKSQLLIFGVGLEKTKADNLLYPNNGWRLKLSLKGASKALLSDQDVMQADLLVKAIKTIGTGRIIGRVQLGSTLVNDFEELPKSLRYFAGGGNSIRGYSYESLGEPNTKIKGKVIGGKNLLNLSVEYQHPITDEWSAAAFVDAGNAFNDWNDYKVEIGMGFGARYRSPVGPVRIDIGFPKGDFKDPHLHLSIGSDL